MMMAVLPADIAAGDFYVRFTEVREWSASRELAM
jgi:hypothetical protein